MSTLRAPAPQNKRRRAAFFSKYPEFKGAPKSIVNLVRVHLSGGLTQVGKYFRPEEQPKPKFQPKKNLVQRFLDLLRPKPVIFKKGLR